MLAAYSDFWQKAAANDGKDFSTMSKLMTGVTRTLVVAAQSAIDQAISLGSARRA